MKKILIFTAIGLIAGFAYFHFWGCESGCTIQSSPYLMSLYGGMLGVTLGLPTKRKHQTQETDTNDSGTQNPGTLDHEKEQSPQV